MFIFFACPKKTNQKKGPLFEGIFKLSLKPSGKLRVAMLLNLEALHGLFCRKGFYFLRTILLSLGACP
jgi:hypothetical protein